MPIENRNLEPGTKLVATYKKETFHALMVAGEEGKVLYRLEDCREFKSPSAAGTAITGKACNGWAFWSVDTGAASEETTDTVQAAEGQVTTTESSIEEDAGEATYVPLEEETDPPSPPAAFFPVMGPPHWPQRTIPLGGIHWNECALGRTPSGC